MITRDDIEVAVYNVLARKGQFVEYLMAHPRRRFTCGDERRCVLAQFIADEAELPKGSKVLVDGDTVCVLTRIGDWEDEVYTSLPEWGRTVVEEFDLMDPSQSDWWMMNDVRPPRAKREGRTVLKHLRELEVL